MLSLLTLFGCSQQPDLGIDLSRIDAALEKATHIDAPPPGSSIEAEALQRFNTFYAEYNAQQIQSGVRSLYAADAFFADPYHLVEGIDAIEHYFIAMAEPALSCTFDIEKSQRAGNDYYCRWTMHLVSRAAPDQTITAQGLTHLRLNPEGKIIFHQDYWDTSALLDRLPVVGFWTRLVKGRILKGLNHE